MKNVLIFAAGAAIGSVVTWKLIEEKYKKLADEEIASVKGTFMHRQALNVKDVEQDEATRDDEIFNETVEYNNKVSSELKYVEEEPKAKPDETEGIIAIIASEEYGTEPGFDTKSWMYWADKVVTDEYDTIVEDPTKEIGSTLSQFDDEEIEMVYVRNGNLKCDYEILRSEKEFNGEY